MADKPAPAKKAFDIPALIVTILIGITAACLVWPQIFPAPDQAEAMNLPNLDKRAAMFQTMKSPIQRDQYCIPLSALGRQLDAALQPDARVYMTGLLGETNMGGMGYYYFLRNYLYPRDVELALDRGTFTERAVEGIAGDSPEAIKTNGFDIIIGFPNNQMQILPLTPKGIPKQP